MATARFPCLVKGELLDSFARRALWDIGLDYNHGTGHGVGSYLNVHEGPSGIANRFNPDDPGIVENMIFSNEPGYYEPGKFGIRIESLVVTKKVNLKVGEPHYFLIFYYLYKITPPLFTIVYIIYISFIVIIELKGQTK